MHHTRGTLLCRPTLSSLGTHPSLSPHATTSRLPLLPASRLPLVLLFAPSLAPCLPLYCSLRCTVVGGNAAASLGGPRRGSRAARSLRHAAPPRAAPPLSRVDPGGGDLARGARSAPAGSARAAHARGAVRGVRWPTLPPAGPVAEARRPPSVLSVASRRGESLLGLSWVGCVASVG